MCIRDRPYIFNEVEYAELFEENTVGDKHSYSAAHWLETDRNTLLKILSKFKNIKSVYKSEEVHDRLMILLGSKSTEVQKLAMDAIFAYKDPTVVKYRDCLLYTSRCV